MPTRSISREGLYEPYYEHDACGIGFMCNIDGNRSHEVIKNGLQILVNLTHRGACGCDPETGDGCGIMFHIPHEFFVAEGQLHGFDLPAPGEYGVGMIFLPRDRESRESCIQILNKAILEEDQELIGWRDVPRDSSTIGWLARENEPVIRQVFIGKSEGLEIGRAHV